MPVEVDDVARNKLRLGQKVGIFYFQYTLLKQTLEVQKADIPLAPRSIERHRDNEPAERQDEEALEQDRKFKLLARHR